jgi:hypothetical protein
MPKRGILRPTAATASTVVISPAISFKNGVPVNATVALGTASQQGNDGNDDNDDNDTPCTHGLKPSRYPRHVYKCYVASAIIAGRFSVADYGDVCDRIDQLVDDQMWDSEANPHVNLRDVSGIRDSLELARSTICFRCPERRVGRKARWKRVSVLESMWTRLQRNVGHERRVCEKCKGYWR